MISLDDKIASVRRLIDEETTPYSRTEAAREIPIMRAILATLEQHERAMADVAWFKQTNAEIAACYHALREQHERAMAERDAETFRARGANEALSAIMREHKRAMAALRKAESAIDDVWLGDPCCGWGPLLTEIRAALDAAQEADRE